MRKSIVSPTSVNREQARLEQYIRFGKISTGLFHDLMKILSVVTSAVDKLIICDSKSIDAALHITNARIAAKRLDRMIYSARKQITNSEMSERFLLNDEVEDVIELLDYEAKKHGVSVIFSADCPIEYAGNAVRFYQIASNIILNAIESYDGKEMIRRDVLVSLSLKKAYIEFVVTDRGCGIPARELKKIFSPFYSSKSAKQSLGLGLAVVKETVEGEFGGCVAVKSRPGKGTIFTIKLPKKPTREARFEARTTDGTRRPLS